MAKKLFDKKTQKYVGIELTLDELAQHLSIEPEQLLEWREIIRPFGRSTPPVYRLTHQSELLTIKKKARVLNSGVLPVVMKKIIENGLLDSYAVLAEDAPEGINAHVWRSYGLIVYLQIKFGIMADAKELAQRAGLTEVNSSTGRLVPSIKTAEKHLRLLQALGYLEIIHDDGSGKGWAGQWKHKGLPKFFQGKS